MSLSLTRRFRHPGCGSHGRIRRPRILSRLRFGIRVGVSLCPVHPVRCSHASPSVARARSAHPVRTICEVYAYELFGLPAWRSTWR